MSYAPLPTAIELQTTRAYIASQYEDIDKAEQRIVELEGQIAALHATIARIRDDIAKKEAYIAPIRRLTFDVLAEIIVFATTDRNANVQDVRTLSAICRTWRHAILHTPRAWSKIVFYYYPPDCIPEPRTKLHTLRDLQEWFSRSGSCPKDLFMRCSRMSTNEAIAVYDLLDGHASEFRSISGNFPSSWSRSNGDPLAPRRLQCLSNPMPFLEHLQLEDKSEMLDLPFYDSLVARAPRLTRLSLSDDTVSYIPSALRLQLSSLSLDSIRFIKLLELLRANDGLPGLQSLSVKELKRANDVSDSELGVVTGLRAFYVGFSYTDKPPPALFRLLAMPQLEQLALKYEGSDPPVKKETYAMLEPLVTSKAPLKSLHLQALPISDVDLLKILGQQPLLERLVLLDAKTSDKICAALSSALPKRQGWLCPRLTRVAFSTDRHTKSDKFRVSRSAMKQLAKTRFNRPSTARLVDLRLESARLQWLASTSRWEWENDEEDLYRFESLFTSAPSPTAWWQVCLGPDLL